MIHIALVFTHLERESSYWTFYDCKPFICIRYRKYTHERSVHCRKLGNSWTNVPITIPQYTNQVLYLTGSCKNCIKILKQIINFNFKIYSKRTWKIIYDFVFIISKNTYKCNSKWPCTNLKCVQRCIVYSPVGTTYSD